MPRKPGVLRLKGNTFYLTFPKCGDQDKAAIISRLNCEETWGERLKYVVVGQELHQDKTKHVHILIKYDRQRDSTDPHVFDYVVDPTKHGNYQVTRSTAKCARYCCKDGDVLAEGIDITPYMPKRGKFDVVAEMIKNGISINDIAKTEPGFVMQNLRKLQDFKKFIEKDTSPLRPTYPAETFTEPLQALDKALLIWGDSGLGKSEFARAHFPNGFLEVGHADRLLDLDTSKHTGIIFQDCSFNHWPIEGVIHLLDMNAEAQLHVRYQVASIPIGFPRVFTHNNYNPFYDGSKAGTAQIQAVERRLNRFHVNSRLYEDQEGEASIGRPTSDGGGSDLIRRGGHSTDVRGGGGGVEEANDDDSSQGSVSGVPQGQWDQDQGDTNAVQGLPQQSMHSHTSQTTNVRQPRGPTRVD